NFNQIIAPIDALLIPLGLNQFANYSLVTNSWSLFGQGEYDLTSRLSVTGGIRYTRDRKDYSYLNSCENVLDTPACPPAFDPATIAGAGLVQDESSEGGITARVQFDYQASDDVLLYASYNRGYKAFNYNAGFAGAAPLEGVRFDGETLNAYEAGFKSELFGNRVRLNLAGYYYDYNDYQAFDQRGTSFVLSNNDATIYGADAELTAVLPYGVDVLLGAAWVETDVEDIPVGGELLDREAPQAPEFTFNFAVGKEQEFSAGTVRLGLDGVYTADYFSQLNNAPVTVAGDHWLVNTRLSFSPPSEQWEAAFFVRNIFNEERLQYAFDITFPGNGLVEQVFAPPRWIGGQLRVNF
ncbi:MAG: TonB-dependent receptor, partial [Pseudomonadota bacterium]